MPMNTATITATTTYIFPMLRMKSSPCAKAGDTQSNCNNSPNTYFFFMLFILARQNSRYFLIKQNLFSK